jgi:hypothetical protein
MSLPAASSGVLNPKGGIKIATNSTAPIVLLLSFSPVAIIAEHLQIV